MAKVYGTDETFPLHLPVARRQMKDQSKKVASLKHKEQVEKSKNARLMEEARKREDNLSENSQQVKVSARIPREIPLPAANLRASLPRD